MRVLWLGVVLLSCVKAPTPPAPPLEGVVVIAAGDISAPEINTQALTATLVEAQRPAAVLLLGDAQYGEGLPAQFVAAYEPTWGRFKAVTHPSPGNHEYKSGAVGYFDYFGASAGEPGKGYYAFDLGAWHLVALNTNDGCHAVPCDAESAQVKWLEADLAANQKKCVLAYWHHPRFSSGQHGPFVGASALWAVLEKHRATLVLNGHEHFYERMAPVDLSGAVTDDGLVQFTVGTGGIGFSDFAQVVPASRAHQNDTFGVLRLVLGEGHWQADFVGVPGSKFEDHASGACR